MYLVLTFPCNSFRFDEELNLFAFLFASKHSGSRTTQVLILTIAKLARPSSTILKSSFENLTRQKRSWMKFERFARTFCRNVGTIGANLCKRFQTSAFEGWTRNFEVRHAWTVLTVIVRWSFKAHSWQQGMLSIQENKPSNLIFTILENSSMSDTLLQ